MVKKIIVIESSYLINMEPRFEKMGKVLKMNVVMVSQQCEHI